MATTRTSLKPVLFDTMHVIDVVQDSVSLDTRMYLGRFHMMYADQQQTAEHLYEIACAVEDMTLTEERKIRIAKRPHIADELRALSELAKMHDAAYVRFVIP